MPCYDEYPGDGWRAVAVLLAAMPDPAEETRFWRQVAREAYDAGRAAGWRDALEAEWSACQSNPLVLGTGPSLAELDALRWGPGGREHFGAPRPGDFPGRAARLEGAA